MVQAQTALHAFLTALETMDATLAASPHANGWGSVDPLESEEDRHSHCQKTESDFVLRFLFYRGLRVYLMLRVMHISKEKMKLREKSYS